MGEHACHANDCEVSVPPRMLMCLKHWWMVPKEIQRRVNANFSMRQCVPAAGVRPTKEWFSAAHDAINAVAAHTDEGDE